MRHTAAKSKKQSEPLSRENTRPSSTPELNGITAQLLFLNRTVGNQAMIGLFSSNFAGLTQNSKTVQSGTKDCIRRQSLPETVSPDANDLLTLRFYELKEIIAQKEHEIMVALATQTIDTKQYYIRKKEVARYQRELFLIDYFINNSALWTGKAPEAMAAIIEAASLSEQETLELLQTTDPESARGIPDWIQEVFFENPEFFPDYMSGLYTSAIEEFRQAADENEDRFNEILTGLIQRPVEDIISDFLWMLQNREFLEWGTDRIDFTTSLTGVSLERLNPGSTSLSLDDLRLRISEHKISWHNFFPGLEEELRFVYPALEAWHFYRLYTWLAEKMEFFRLMVVDAGCGMIGHSYEPVDVRKDLNRAYGSRSPQVTEEAMREGLETLFSRIQSKLDGWVRGLSWDKRIYEGFGLYDILGEFQTNVKELVSLEAILVMAGFMGFLIAIQAVPYANILVDAILLTLGGIDFLKFIIRFGTYFDKASESKKFMELYHAAQSLKGGGEDLLNALMSLINWAAGKGVKHYIRYRNAKKFKSLDEIADHEVITKADPEVRKAFETANGLAKIDPENLLGPVLAKRVDPRIIEQALLSGLTPRQLLQICGNIKDEKRLYKLLEYASDNADAVIPWLESGSDPVLVAKMMDEGRSFSEVNVLEDTVSPGVQPLEGGVPSELKAPGKKPAIDAETGQPHTPSSPGGLKKPPVTAELRSSIAPRGWPIQKVTYDNFPDVVPQKTVLEFPDGQRVWRTRDGAIAIESKLGPGTGRRDFEKRYFTPSEAGYPGYHRTHSQGQGTGFESPYSIPYAPAKVNLILQNSGIEAYLRRLYAESPANVRYHLITETYNHWGSLRLKQITYRVDVEIDGVRSRFFEFQINVGKARTDPPVWIDHPWVSKDPALQSLINRFDMPDVLRGKGP